MGDNGPFNGFGPGTQSDGVWDGTGPPTTAGVNDGGVNGGNPGETNPHPTAGTNTIYTSSETSTAQDTVTPMPNPSASTTTFTSESTQTFVSLATPSSDNDDGGGDGGGGGLSNNTKIAIAVPIAVVGAAIIAAILFFLLRRRRRQRQLESRPVISTPQLDNSSSVFLPPRMQPVPAPPPAPITRRAVPQGPYVEQSETARSESATVVSAAAARDLEWRTSEERADRPRSPFDHPQDNDDALSIVSGMSDREAVMRARGPRDDDMSSVSSFEDDEPRATTNQGS
ncbi:uncharacterized protein BJX67DRAFT_376661 [Aspergillus lucknowensis]|uniref:Uncharacterized protein n=1 Tax=Aspergillus lucknowensis TaxID=176173 RepID=A0ABR4M5B2_9EURO